MGSSPATTFVTMMSASSPALSVRGSHHSQHLSLQRLTTDGDRVALGKYLHDVGGQLLVLVVIDTSDTGTTPVNVMSWA